MKMIFPRYRDVSEDETEEVNEQQKVKLLTIKNNIKMKQNEIKKYTVKVSNNETEANFDFNKIEIAKAAASLFVLDDKYHTVMLVDNETNKGIHFDPMTDLTQEQRDKIKELNNNNMKTNETMTVNGSVVNEVLAFNTDVQVDEDTFRLNRLSDAFEGLLNTLEKLYVKKKMKQYKDKVFDLDAYGIQQEIDELECKIDTLTEEENKRLEELNEKLTKDFYGFSPYEGDWTVAAYVDDIPYSVFLMFAKEEFELFYNENEQKTFYIHNLNNFDETVFGVEDEDIQFIKK